MTGRLTLPPDYVPQFYWPSGLRQRYGQVGRALEGWSGSQTGRLRAAGLPQGGRGSDAGGANASAQAGRIVEKTQQLVGGSDGPEFLSVLFRTCRIAAINGAECRTP